MPSDSLEYIEHKVIPYRFDDDEINFVLAELNRKSCQTIQRCKKQLFILKFVLVLCAFLLTALFEYMMFVSLWYREPIFKIVMIFTPFFLQMSTSTISSFVLPPREANTITSPSCRKPVAPWGPSAGEINLAGWSMQQRRCAKC